MPPNIILRIALVCEVSAQAFGIFGWRRYQHGLGKCLGAYYRRVGMTPTADWSGIILTCDNPRDTYWVHAEKVIPKTKYLLLRALATASLCVLGIRAPIQERQQ